MKLEDVSGIGKATAERLKAAGIDSVEKLANIKVEDLLNLKIKGVGKATAQKYINNAKSKLEGSKPQEQPKSKVKSISEAKPKTKPKAKPVSKPEVTKLKELIKQQAECNIGLVGHVDHGI
jgi:nucleotidyltransferase/DNA polymerase involved in DNA repair